MSEPIAIIRDRAISHLHTEADFFADGSAMRAVFDDRFADPRHVHRDRFVWDYWFVRDQYTYLRTLARQYFPAPLFGRFLQRLRAWGGMHLGCTQFTEPWLSYYIDGCRQELHEDGRQGRWAFVYSLTNWSARRFDGGETLLLRSALPHHVRAHEAWGTTLAQERFFLRVPPAFNQLLIFDARVPHGVALVQGSRDPLDSRLVIHGWFQTPRLESVGALETAAARAVIDEAGPTLTGALEGLDQVTGWLVVAMEVAPHGSSTNLTLLATTLSGEESDCATDLALDWAVRLRFPARTAGSRIVLPISLPPTA